jgi:hypothetical protein
VLKRLKDLSDCTIVNRPLPMTLLLLDPRKEAVFVNQYPSANTNDGGVQFVSARIEQQPPQTAFTECRISG